MAMFWIKKKEDHSKEKATMQAEDFMQRLTKHKEDEPADKPKIENTK